MSEIKQAKNLEDMLDLIDEASLAHRECHELLRSHGDTASIMAAKRSLDSQGNLQNLAKDILAGLVDLSAVTFDPVAQDLAYTPSGLVLKNEPERRDGHERRD
jgi:hypothetical protein